PMLWTLVLSSKFKRLRNRRTARALMFAADQPAIQTDPNTTQVLIRSYIHPSTRTRGVYVKDNPHITISVKNPETAKQGEHESSHSYTPHLKSFNVVTVVRGGYIKDDRVGNTWPSEIEARPRDAITGDPGLLGPKEEFITWPAEKTGE
ncbi:hypothetical protein CH063_05839, partial [Colletotrichum higginsianum]